MEQTTAAELARLEQSLSSFASQKQFLISQQLEVDNALAELGATSGATFRIVGSVMVACERATLLQELSEQKETLTLRLSSLEKQETLLRKKAEALQQELVTPSFGGAHHG